MPYINMHEQRRLEAGEAPMGAGGLTWQLQQTLKDYLNTQGLSYQQLAECLGALEGCKLDFIERVVKPYEQRKLNENGDVWPVRLTDADRHHEIFGEASSEYSCSADEVVNGGTEVGVCRPQGQFATRDGEIVALDSHQQAVLRGAGGDLRAERPA